MSAEIAATTIWTVWYGTWIAAVMWSAKTAVQLKSDIRSLSRLCFGLGLVIAVVFPDDGSVLGSVSRKLWQYPPWAAWMLVAAVVGCFAFCWWARLHLGRLWSGYVTLKEGHHIVDTGPYGIVRHPIYTGIIFATFFTALLRATPASFVGLALVAAGLAAIARTEERFLRVQLDAESYDNYRKRVSMLIPLIG